MERNMVLAVIFSAAAVVGAIETVYQVYQLTVIDAAARGLKHPKLWGLLAANGNNSSGLLLYLIGRRNYPVNSMDSRQVVVMEKRKKTAGIGLVFVAVGAIGLVLCLARVVPDQEPVVFVEKQKEKAKAIPGVMQPVLNHRHVPCVSRQKVRRWDTILIAGPR